MLCCNRIYFISYLSIFYDILRWNYWFANFYVNKYPLTTCIGLFVKACRVCEIFFYDHFQRTAVFFLEGLNEKFPKNLRVVFFGDLNSFNYDFLLSFPLLETRAFALSVSIMVGYIVCLGIWGVYRRFRTILSNLSLFWGWNKVSGLRLKLSMGINRGLEVLFS